MRLTRKWVNRPRESSVVPLHHLPAAQPPEESQSKMPTRGYRKGQTDRKVPVPRSVRTHISEWEFEQLKADADSRAITLSKLVRALIEAHVDEHRLELPHARGPSCAAIRELARIGNNLNQIAHQANLMNLNLIATEARKAIATITDVVRRLA